MEKLYEMARASADEMRVLGQKLSGPGSSLLIARTDVEVRVHEARIQCALIGVLVGIEKRLAPEIINVEEKK